MSTIFGPIYQNGYVVRDMDAAINHWVNRLGIGPFYRMMAPFKSYVHRGVKSNPLVEVALAYSGDLQIELIVQQNDEPSHYQEFLAQHGPGLQHLSVNTDNFDSDLARWKKEGREPMTEIQTYGGRVVFFDTDIAGGTGFQMEVLEMQPGTHMAYKKIKADSISWDGKDPIRRFAGA